MARTSRAVDSVEVDLGVEMDDKVDVDDDGDNGERIGSYHIASEKVCGCTLARYQSYILATVAVFVIMKMIVVMI